MAKKRIRVGCYHETLQDGSTWEYARDDKGRWQAKRLIDGMSHGDEPSLKAIRATVVAYVDQNHATPEPETAVIPDAVVYRKGPGRPVYGRFGQRKRLKGYRIWHVTCPSCRVPHTLTVNHRRFECSMMNCGHTYPIEVTP